MAACESEFWAAGLNRADLLTLSGSYRPAGRTEDVYIAGMEYAGIVETASPHAPDLPTGARVMGLSRGTFADYALSHPLTALPIPDDLSFSEAAALPTGLATEHDALVTQAGFRSGQSVLVVGATSAVGLIAVQLAKAFGASFVAATTTNDAKRAALYDAGADIVVNTKTESLDGAVRSAMGDRGVDIVLDHIGGPLFATLPVAAAIQGTIVNVGRLGGNETTIDLDQIAFRRLRVLGTTFSVRTLDEIIDVVSTLKPVVSGPVGDGSVRPVIDRIYNVEDFLDAETRMQSNQAVGKIVLQFDDTGS